MSKQKFQIGDKVFLITTSSCLVSNIDNIRIEVERGTINKVELRSGVFVYGIEELSYHESDEKYIFATIDDAKKYAEDGIKTITDGFYKSCAVAKKKK